MLARRSALLLPAALWIVACSGGDGSSASTFPGAAATPSGNGASSATPSSPSTPVTSNPPPSTARDAGASEPASDAGGGGGTDASAAIDAALPGWTLTWSDEFNLPDGSAIDSTYWNQETGGSGWNNNEELEYYTPGTANAIIQGGALVITASTEGASQYQCGYGTCQYTSARFNTQGKFQQSYGRFESRIQIPRGQGLWPAFWVLGDNIGSVGWPQCGEIDIMENIGSEPATNHGSLHGPGYSGGHDLTATTSISSGTLADDFHIYAVEWEPNVVRFYLDDTLYETRTPADVPAGDQWVYDHPFFVILNVAVGGDFPGNPNSSTQFPQTMKVDYVRVYSQAP